jgi:hypothetical protein
MRSLIFFLRHSLTPRLRDFILRYIHIHLVTKPFGVALRNASLFPPPPGAALAEAFFIFPAKL